MSDIVVALIGLVGTFLGAYLGGSITLKIAMAKVETRLEILEKKVDKHNNLVERTYKLEGQVLELENDIKELKHS